MDTNTASAAAVRGATVVLNIWPWGMVTAAVAFLCAMAIQRMAGGLALRPLRHEAPGHWTERARLAYPGWVTLTLGQIFQPFLWILGVGVFPDDHGFGVAPLVGLAAFIGAGLASVRLESRVRERPVSMLDWARAWAVQGLLYFGPYVLMFVMFSLLPNQFNWTVFWLVAGYLGLVLVLSMGGIVVLGRWTGLLRRAPARLSEIVDQAAERMGVERPVAYVLRWKAANALAFPFARTIAITDTALDSCSDEELLAICCHELAHLNESRCLRWARLTGQLVWLPLVFIGPLEGTLGSPAGVMVAFVAFLLAQWLVNRMRLALEKRADSAGKAHEGEAGTYARALEKLYQINLMPAVTRSRFLTHPHLYDRLLAAGITPDYPRPGPPSRWRAKVALAFLLLGTVFCVLIWVGVVQTVQLPGKESSALP